MKIKPNKSLNDWINDEDWEDNLSAHSGKPFKPAKNAPPLNQAGGEVEDQFNFSYHASRHERQWIEDSLGRFYQQHWIDDVLRLLKGGKEASVYLCQGNPTAPATAIAAKVYRPRKFRNLKNDWIYREGRANRDSNGNIITEDGLLHAIRKKTDLGRHLLHAAWIEHEYQTLLNLHQSGVDVPCVYARGDNAILMEYLGDGVLPAPTLSEIDLEPSEARQIFERVIANVEIMLAQGCVHGDLSAYNILYWDGDIRLIDFPQAVSPHENHNAWSIFSRDVARVCEYFSAQGVAINNAPLLAREIWHKQRLSTAPTLDPLYLDPENPHDREYWHSETGEIHN
jgi:RIO kinase 1